MGLIDGVKCEGHAGGIFLWNELAATKWVFSVRAAVLGKRDAVCPSPPMASMM